MYILKVPFYDIHPITHCLKWNRLCFSTHILRSESRGRSIQMNLRASFETEMHFWKNNNIGHENKPLVILSNFLYLLTPNISQEPNINAPSWDHLQTHINTVSKHMSFHAVYQGSILTVI